MVKCSWGADCPNEAKGQVEIWMWALQMPQFMRTKHNCVKMLSSVVVCEEHKREIKPTDMLLPEGKERIANALTEVGRAVPDFEKAELHFLDIIDEPLDPNNLVPPGAHVVEG